MNFNVHTMSFIKFAQGKGWLAPNDEPKTALFPVSLERFLEYARYQLERADSGFIRYQSATDYLTQLNYTHRLLNLDWTDVYNHPTVAQIRDEIFSKHRNAHPVRKRKSSSPKKSPRKSILAADSDYEGPDAKRLKSGTEPIVQPANSFKIKITNMPAIIEYMKNDGNHGGSTSTSTLGLSYAPSTDQNSVSPLKSPVEPLPSITELPRDSSNVQITDQDEISPYHIIPEQEELSDQDPSRESMDIDSTLLSDNLPLHPDGSADGSLRPETQEHTVFLVGENSTGIALNLHSCLDGGNNYLRFAQNQGYVGHFKDWRTLFPVPIDHLISYLEFLGSEENTRVRGVTTVRKYLHDIKKLHGKLGFADWEVTALVDSKVVEKISAAEQFIEERNKRRYSKSLLAY